MQPAKQNVFEESIKGKVILTDGDGQYVKIAAHHYPKLKAFHGVGFNREIISSKGKSVLGISAKNKHSGYLPCVRISGLCNVELGSYAGVGAELVIDETGRAVPRPMFGITAFGHALTDGSEGDVIPVMLTR